MTAIEKDSRRSQLDLHLAEYEALTTRATNYIVMGTIIWPLMVSFVGFLAVVWEHLTPDQSCEYGFFIVIWCGTLGIQLALILWTFLVCEQYKLVLYIEKELRPRVSNLVGDENFWLYERKLRKQPRINKWFELTTDFWIFIFILAVVIFRLITSHEFVYWDWIGLSLNLAVFGVLLFWGVTAARIHQKWES